MAGRLNWSVARVSSGSSSEPIQTIRKVMVDPILWDGPKPCSRIARPVFPADIYRSRAARESTSKFRVDLDGPCSRSWRDVARIRSDWSWQHDLQKLQKAAATRLDD